MAKENSYNIGRFKILRRIGKGAQGSVFLAEDPYLQRRVAIKVLTFKSQDQEVRKRALLQEAGAVGRLKHPNIVPIFEADDFKGTPYLVFEYVHGISLKQLLEKTHLSIPQSLKIITQVSDGVAYAHEHGIIHRDLKPSNILISNKGVPRITDFGISEKVGAHNLGGNVLKGSLPYMAPEHFSEKPIYPSSDIFSVGLILHEMLTHVQAINADNEFAIIYKINFEPSVAPSLMNPRVDKMLDEIVLKAVQKEPEARYPDATSMKQEIYHYLAMKRGVKVSPLRKEETNSTVNFLLRRMKHKSDFPAFSASILEINNKASSTSNVSASELANTILKDYALTNKLLKLANSAFYRQIKGGVSDINKAVVLLGFEQVRLASSSLMLFNHFGDNSSAIELRDAMIKSFMSGIIARDIAIQEGIKKEETGFLCSMFHNLGKNLTIYYFPEEYEEIKNQISEKNIDMQHSALDILGISFDELGVSVAREWKFPESIIYSMRSLPDGTPEPPISVLDKLRHYSVFANELCELVDNNQADKISDSFDYLTKRFNQSFSISNEQLDGLLDTSINKILTYASVLDIDTKKSPFIQNLLKFVEFEDILNKSKVQENKKLITDKLPDAGNSSFSSLLTRIWYRITTSFKK